MALFIGPSFAWPKKAAIEVAAPVIVRTALGISSIYTPGYVGVTGMGTSFCNQLLLILVLNFFV
jgi:hypothetical protein